MCSHGWIIHDSNTDAHANSNSYSDDYAIAHFNTDSDCYTNVNGNPYSDGNTYPVFASLALSTC